MSWHAFENEEQDGTVVVLVVWVLGKSYISFRVHSHTRHPIDLLILRNVVGFALLISDFPFRS